MTHVSHAAPHAITEEDKALVGGAWLGPALGAGILTIAWTLYLIPLLIGIFSVGF